MQQGSYPIGSRTININTDNATGVVTGATCDIPLNALAIAIQQYLGLTLPLSLSSGGTGATTAASARTNLGLGSIATQNANAVGITGGSIDNTPIGATTPSSGVFSSLSSTSPVSVSSGGTGVNNLAAHGVVVGNGASAVSVVGPGTSTQALFGTGLSSDPAFRAITPNDVPVMVASGASHAAGLVPDPGVSVGLSRILREDGTWDSIPGPVLDTTFYGAVANGTDQSAKVQLALNALGTPGGTVVNPAGVKFKLKSLTFPVKCNFEYYATDDQSPGATQALVTNERIILAANATTGAGGGIVNEWRWTAPFHPGMMLDIRKDVLGQTSFLGAGQTQANPARASFNIHDEQVDTYRTVYETYPDYTIFAGIRTHGWRRVIALNGIGPSQWSSTPAANATITGNTSGARGILLRIDSSPARTLVHWITGVYVAGETLSATSGPTSTIGVTTVSGMSLQENQGLASDNMTGNWSVGLPPGSVTDTFGVGGQITSVPTRSYGQWYGPATQVPALNLMDGYEGAKNGYAITYDTTVALASRRLTLRKYGTTTDVAHLGAIRSHASFTDSGSAAVVGASPFNVASIVRGGSTGRYDVTFSNALTSTAYRIAISHQFSGFVTWDVKSTTGFSLFVFNASNAAQWAPFGVDFTIIGGDI